MSQTTGLAAVDDAPVVVEMVVADGPDDSVPISKSKFGLVEEVTTEETEEQDEEGTAEAEKPPVAEAPSHKEHEVTIAEPEPQQFAEAKSEHTGQYIKRTRSSHGSKMHLSPSKAAVSPSKMHLSPSKAAVSPSKMHLSPSQAAMSKSRTKIGQKMAGTPSKPEVRSSLTAGGGEDTHESSSKTELAGRTPSRSSDVRRSSRLRSLTSQDRLMTMSEEGSPRRKHSERRSSARAHGTLTGSIISFRRTSGEVDRAKIPRMQNTYRMESKRPFNADCVSIILREVIEKECASERYDASKSPRFAMSLSSEIRARIKLQHFDRYKIIVYVNVCEKQQQSLHSVMRFLWDPEKDNYSTYSFENTTMFVIATAFGVYYE